MALASSICREEGASVSLSRPTVVIEVVARLAVLNKLDNALGMLQPGAFGFLKIVDPVGRDRCLTII